MSLSAYRFIDPYLLASLSDLQLVAQRVVDGFMLGRHQSPHAGAGLEFSQYRSYEPGDDLRRIDWKTYARSDRFFVRESEVETSISVRIILDSSASMSYREGQLSKLDYGRFLAACLGYLGYRQGDAVGLLSANTEAVQELPPDRGSSHWHRFLGRLEAIDPQAKWPSWQTLQGRLEANRLRQMVILISDLYQHDDELESALRKLAVQHEVLVFHLMGQRELDFSYRGSFRFRDLETGQALDVDTDQVRDTYHQKLSDYLRRLRREFAEQGVSYELLRLDQPLDAALRSFLERRRARES